jgi:ATP-dependent Clp protease ATP-binding subunit ClpC
MFERYTEKARRVIFFARYEASQFGSPYIETEHLLLGVIREDKSLTNRFLRSDVSSIRKQIESSTAIREKASTSVDLPLSNESKRVLAYAAEEAERLNQHHIGTEHLLLGLMREEKSFAERILTERGVQLARVREELARQPHQSEPAPQRAAPYGERGPYISDLETQPLIGREKELDRLMEILCRFSKKNPVLVGEPGAGKRTIVGELARRMTDGKVPRALADKVILGLDLPPLRALEKDGAWQEKVDRALVAAAEEGKIFFVNHMHEREGIPPGASFHVTELLLRPIMAGKIQCIATSTPATFARLQAEKHWLAGYFEPIDITPASEEAAIAVLQGIKQTYEKFHSVSFADDAIAHAVACAKKHIKNRSLPGAAVDIIDAAGAAAQLKQGSLPEEFAEVQKRIRFIAERLQSSMRNREFVKARFYSAEESKELENLKQLREKHKLDDNPAVTIRPEAIERAVRELTGNPDPGSKTS